MKQIFTDNKGGRFEIPEEHVEDAIKDGLEPAFDMADEQGGKYLIPKSQYQNAIKDGLKHLHEIENKQLINEQYKKNRAEEMGAVEAGLRGAVDTMTFGQGKHLAGLGRTAEEKATIAENYDLSDQAALESNPLAYLGGAAIPAAAVPATLGLGVAEGVGRVAADQIDKGELDTLGLAGGAVLGAAPSAVASTPGILKKGKDAVLRGMYGKQIQEFIDDPSLLNKIPAAKEETKNIRNLELPQARDEQLTAVAKNEATLGSIANEVASDLQTGLKSTKAKVDAAYNATKFDNLKSIIDSLPEVIGRDDDLRRISELVDRASPTKLTNTESVKDLTKALNPDSYMNLSSIQREKLGGLYQQLIESLPPEIVTNLSKADALYKDVGDSMKAVRSKSFSSVTPEGKLVSSDKVRTKLLNREVPDLAANREIATKLNPSIKDKLLNADKLTEQMEFDKFIADRLKNANRSEYALKVMGEHLDKTSPEARKVYDKMKDIHTRNTVATSLVDKGNALDSPPPGAFMSLPVLKGLNQWGANASNVIKVHDVVAKYGQPVVSRIKFLYPSLMQGGRVVDMQLLNQALRDEGLSEYPIQE